MSELHIGLPLCSTAIFFFLIYEVSWEWCVTLCVELSLLMIFCVSLFSLFTKKSLQYICVQYYPRSTGFVVSKNWYLLSRHATVSLSLLRSSSDGTRYRVLLELCSQCLRRTSLWQEKGSVLYPLSWSWSNVDTYLTFLHSKHYGLLCTMLHTGL